MRGLTEEEGSEMRMRLKKRTRQNEMGLRKIEGGENEMGLTQEEIQNEIEMRLKKRRYRSNTRGLK